MCSEVNSLDLGGDERTLFSITPLCPLLLLLQVTPLLIDRAESPMGPQTVLSASFPSVVSYHKDWGILSEAEARKTQNALQNGNLLEVVSAVLETVRRASSVPVNIAVTGNSGNGISTFINALRGIGNEEEDSAPTGVVRTTLTRAHYSSSHLPNVVLWDLPGLGVTSQSLEDYVVEMQFNDYDLFIIIVSEQFSMNHGMLAKIIENMGKKFYIVWTKLDIDLRSTTLKGEPQKIIRDSILENLQKNRVSKPPIFMISSHESSWHDFPKLRDTLQKDLSEIRCHGPLQTLLYNFEKIINDKVAYFQKEIATNSFPNIQNADDLTESLNVYRLSFGVHDGSLRQVAQRMGKESLECTAITKSQDLPAFVRGDWALKFMSCILLKICLCILSWFPLLGGWVVHFEHFVRRRKQKRVLEIVAEYTKTVLRKILKDSLSQARNQHGNSTTGSFSGGSHNNWVSFSQVKEI
ncbi:PREDICTED: immunity-related GTPase family M protein 1-like [Chrysochloris asiatica]|uniref:Immunity-related GTPase family M protein 1-like n=1 Tax=Chrysochloris asiatica TaxID=185453 RepID=A0A9B0TH63_CHRAS|nr:PREDICTED: immunity-related GTPase family M protein 1-like [Chrysochloris asiatica]